MRKCIYRVGVYKCRNCGSIKWIYWRHEVGSVAAGDPTSMSVIPCMVCLFTDSSTWMFPTEVPIAVSTNHLNEHWEEVGNERA